MSSLTNALKFEALMCAAYEVIRHAKAEYIQCAMEPLEKLPPQGAEESGGGAEGLIQQPT